jgi:class 3 adenylate cyclase
MPLYFDSSNRALKQQLEALAPTPGYCVFVDITDSTLLKDRSIAHWAAQFHNAFRHMETFMPSGTTPLKCLGDALMYFVRAADLPDSGNGVLQLFDGLASIVDDTDTLFPEQKAVVVLGEAFELSFVPDQPDVYGKDIDLASRLLSRARPRELLMNQAFSDAVKAAYADCDLSAGFGRVEEITQLRPWRPKGFSTAVEMFSYRGPELPARVSAR